MNKLYSEETGKIIDEEVRKLIEVCYSIIPLVDSDHIPNTKIKKAIKFKLLISVVGIFQFEIVRYREVCSWQGNEEPR